MLRCGALAIEAHPVRGPAKGRGAGAWVCSWRIEYARMTCAPVDASDPPSASGMTNRPMMTCMRIRRGAAGSWAIAAVAIVVIGASGCDEEEAGIAVEQFPDRELDARCNFLVRCGFMPNLDFCLEANGTDPEAVQAVGAIAFERAEYDPGAAAHYVELLRTASCDLEELVARELDDAREAVFTGKVPEDDPCFADWECAGNAVCDRQECPGDQLCCTGRCVTKRVLTVGDDCPLEGNPDLLYTACEPTAYCEPPQDWEGEEPPLVGRCAPRVDNGMPCTSSAQCLEDQRCDVNGSNTCFKLSLTGEMCNPMLSEGSCLGLDRVCDTNLSTCVERPRPGEACVQGRCIQWAECRDDVCVARPGPGEPCGDGPPCLGRLQCRDGVCEGETIALVCVDGEDPPPPEDEGE